jgi:hypothetical protein
MVTPLACSASKRPSTELARSAAKARVEPAMPLSSCAPRSSSFKQIAEQPSRALADDHHVRLSDALQARRKVRRLADDRLLLCSTRADQITDHDQPDRDADPGSQRGARLEAGYRRDQLSPARAACSASSSSAFG